MQDHDSMHDSMHDGRTSRRNLTHGTLVVATALPALAVVGLARATSRRDFATRSRRRTRSVPVIALLITAPFWLILLSRGVLYPLFAAGNLDDSWGGPTLAGAWAAHLGIGIVALLAVSLVLAWWRPPDARRSDP